MNDRHVFVSGNFFVLHPGHIRFLRFASEIGDRLTIGVRPTRPTERYPSVEERIDALKAIGIATEVVSISDGLDVMLRRLKPDVVVKGKEYESSPNPETSVLSEWGGELIFSSGESTYSGLDPNLEQRATSQSLNLVRPAEFARRRDCDLDSLLRLIDRFEKLKVIVVGDTIVDEYVSCDALGMSREDPTIVVSPRQTDRYVGGAGIVAAHASSLGASTSFFSIVGHDQAADFVNQRLSAYGVFARLLPDESRPTTLKRRYRCEGKTLLRVSDLRQHEASEALQQQLHHELSESIKSADVLIFSDFNYGCLPQRLVDQMTVLAKQRGCVLAADSQSSSQLGDISRFKGMHLITPTEHEARVALKDQLSGLSTLGRQLLQRSNSHGALITLGASGVLVVDRHDSVVEPDRIPALNRAPSDVSGAGDSLLVTAALTLACGGSLHQAAYLGSFAAAIQTSRTGNIPIAREELKRVIH